MSEPLAEDPPFNLDTSLSADLREGGGNEPGGEPAAPAHAEPAAEAPPSSEPEPPAPSLTAEDIQALHGLADLLRAAETAPPPVPVEQPVVAGPPVPDPFSDTYAEDLAAYVQHQVQAAEQNVLQRVQPTLQTVEQQRAQEWLTGQLGGYEQTIGPLIDPVADDASPEQAQAVQALRDRGHEAAAFYAQGLITQAAETGQQPIDPGVALRRGYELIHGLLKDAREMAGQQAVARNSAELAAVGSAARFPNGTGGAEGVPEPANEREAARLFIARNSTGV